MIDRAGPGLCYASDVIIFGFIYYKDNKNKIYLSLIEIKIGQLQNWEKKLLILNICSSNFLVIKKYALRIRMTFFF